MGEHGGTGKYNIEVAHTQKDKNHILSPVQLLVWCMYGMSVNDSRCGQSRKDQERMERDAEAGSRANGHMTSKWKGD